MIMERITYADLPKGMFEHLRKIEDFIENSTISAHLLELVRLRLAQKNGCAYCVDMHHKKLKHLQESDLRLSSLCVWQDTPYFSDQEQVVLHYAEQLTQLKSGPLENELFDRLKKYFNKEEICYLSLAICQTNTWNRLMKAFQFTPGQYEVKED